MDEYRTHLETPEIIGYTWLGGLYSLISISLRFWHSDPAIPTVYQDTPLEWSEFFCQSAARCLALGEITNPVKGTVESCIMFLHAGFSHTRNDITWAWLTAGDILRLAMRMGYHRDPSQYPHLSAFEGEMRRRVFQFIYQTDLLCSFQIGLTPAIRAIEYDSQPSRNFHENQLTPAMIALPPALDNSEPTYYAYFVAQSRLFRVFGDIVEHLNALEMLPYSKVLVLDDRLRKAFELIPPHLRRTLPDSTTDPPRVVLQRIELEMFYHKVNCVLHRRYMLVSPRKADYSFSCQSCIDSALRILTCQVILHNNERWPHVEWWSSSFTLHDFTLAGTVLCLYLAKRKEEARPTETVIKILEALATSHALWSEVRDTSSDARQAFGILEKMRGGLDGGLIKSPDWPVLSDLTGTMGPESPLITASVTNNSSLVGTTYVPDFGATNVGSEINWGIWDADFRNVEPIDLPHPT